MAASDDYQDQPLSSQVNHVAVTRYNSAASSTAPRSDPEFFQDQLFQHTQLEMESQSLQLKKQTQWQQLFTHAQKQSRQLHHITALYNKLVREAEQLIGERSNLSSNKRCLDEETIEHENEKQQLKQNIAQLETENKKLAQNLELDSKVCGQEFQELRDEIEKLKLSKEAVVQENQKLKKEDEKTKLEKQGLVRVNELLIEKQKQDKQEHSELGMKFSTLVNRFNSQEEKIEQMQSENRQLQSENKQLQQGMRSPRSTSRMVRSEVLHEEAKNALYAVEALKSTFVPTRANLHNDIYSWQSALPSAVEEKEAEEAIPSTAGPNEAEKVQGMSDQEPSMCPSRTKGRRKFHPDGPKYMQAKAKFAQYAQHADPDQHFKDHFKSAPEEWQMYVQWCRESGQIPIKRPRGIPNLDSAR